jgi:D-glycero-D-manno-heptose 1,7-bisphosphate phosphatase
MSGRIERVVALLLPAPRGLEPALWTQPGRGRSLLDGWADILAEAEITTARVLAAAGVEPLRPLAERQGLRIVAARTSGGLTADADLADLVDSADLVVIVPVDGYSDIDLRPLLGFHRRHGGPMTRAWYGTGCGSRPGPIVADASALRGLAARDEIGAGLLSAGAGRMPAWTWGGYHREIATPEDLARAAEEAAGFLPARRVAERRAAVFLDRDGTIIEDVPYLSDPAGIRFLPGAIESLARLRRAGFARVLATNQSGIGRGLFTEARLAEIHAEFETRLAAVGASLDAIYHCPAAPPEDGEPDCPDRKPAPGMLLRAALELEIDLVASWMVGDKMSDVQAGLAAGCRSILLRPGGDPDTAGEAVAYQTAPDIAAAVELILAEGRS